jgi:DnaD/phage-associated family protein
MTPMPWFRVYSEILDDRKIKRICKKTGHSKALVIGVWIGLLALANDSPDRGTLSISEDMPVTQEDLEDELGLPGEIINQLMDEFVSMGMVNGKATLKIANWERRQFKSDNSTERVREYREKRSTPEDMKRFRNVIDTEQIQNRTDTENREEPEPEPEPTTTTVIEEEFPNVVNSYQENIGVISHTIADLLKSATEHYPPGWIPDAIDEAVKNNVRKWSYIDAILKNWETNGRNGKGRKKKQEKDKDYLGSFSEFIQH